MNLQGRVAIVTGASRGIGAAIARRLAQDGATVACVASRAENASETVASIVDAGASAKAFGCDVGDYSAIERSVGEITEQLGSPTIIVNNAGLTKDALMMRLSEEDWDRVIDVNLKGAFAYIRHAHRAMMKERWGRIVNVTSVVGLHGAAGQTNYSSSKAGLVGLTMSVAKELGSRGVTCNAVAPGFIDTDMTAGLAQEMKDQAVKMTPVGRLGTPEDIAAVVGFLCSDAAAFVTGQTLTVDGGMTL